LRSEVAGGVELSAGQVQARDGRVGHRERVDLLQVSLPALLGPPLASVIASVDHVPQQGSYRDLDRLLVTRTETAHLDGSNQVASVPISQPLLDAEVVRWS